MSNAGPQTIDVRELPHGERHEPIHRALDGFEPGDTLEVISDHEPHGLLSEFDELRPGELHWSSTEAGPSEWHTMITRDARILDVRPLIDAGEEPFETIMAMVGSLGDEDLVIVAPFEPTPLEGVLSSQGFTFDANEVEPGHWRTRFSLGV